MTLLIAAAKTGNIKLLQKALAQGHDIEAVSNGWTVLGWAIRSGSLECVQHLIQAGANVNNVNRGEFEGAIIYPEMVQVLINNGYDIDKKWERRGSHCALSRAVDYRCYESAKLLMRHGCLLGDSRQAPMVQAILKEFEKAASVEA